MGKNHIPVMQRKNASSVHEQEQIQHSNPQNSILSLQRLIGNQATQQMLAKNGSIQREEEQETESSGRFSTGWERFKDKMPFLKPDHEKIMEEFKESLDTAKKYCEYGTYVMPDGKMKDGLKQAADQFGGVSGEIENLYEITDTIGEVLAFIDAVEAVAKVDMQENPDEAAVAFGKLFATTGKLGEKLPEGPWTAYFKLLGYMENFFTSMKDLMDHTKNPQHGQMVYDIVNNPNKR